VSYWSNDATNSFQFDPPNAVLTSVDGDEIKEVEVVITGASFDGSNIIYTIENPILTNNQTFVDVSLFVDGNGNDCDTIYLADNGITIKACEGASIGDTGVINDVTYTIVHEINPNDPGSLIAFINAGNADKAVTTFVTDMRILYSYNAYSQYIRDQSYKNDYS
jgi:hypothetical protein